PKTKKGSGLKLIFEANLHFFFANGTDEECLAYTSKDYDRCKLPEHNPNPKKGQRCKCDFKDLSKICEYCNENCKRPFSRTSNDPLISGPFLFKSDNDRNNDKNYIEAYEDLKNRKEVHEVISKHATKCID